MQRDDDLGRELSRTTTAAGPVSRASLTRTYNRAGQVLSEASTISGDPANGTATYTYDPLERLTSFTSPASTTTTYGWDEVPNRTSVQVGAGSPVTTTYDAANRPKDQAGVANAYASDADGRLTTQPTSAGAGFQRYEWDSLGRLTTVKPPSGGGTTATYTYDPLDRLRLADYGGNTRTRFRYVGLTTAVAQTINDATGAVVRHIGTGWGGERQLDWTGTSSNIRYYGSNAHHDTVWTASSTGAVSATLRYDPFGTLTDWSGTSLPDFRFQGSWYDTTTSIAWVVTRWYAPGLGRFLSEDSLLGEPADPPSRHLYAYAAGEPIGRWDPDGRAAYRVIGTVSVYDPEPFPGFRINSLTLDVRWTTRVACCVGLRVIHSVSWNTSISWYRYPPFASWDTDIHWERITEGGVGKTFVGVKTFQSWDYLGQFSFICPLCYNKLAVSVYAKATGAAGCTFSVSYRMNTFDLLHSKHSCRYATY